MTRTFARGRKSSADETLAMLALFATPIGQGFNAVNVVGGGTVNLIARNMFIRMASDGAHPAPISNLPVPSYIGETHTFIWLIWDVSQVPPVINATGGKTLVPFAGLAASGGTVASTTITTPGASYTLEWDGTEWIPPA